jgi:hypothetical protein
MTPRFFYATIKAAQRREQHDYELERFNAFLQIAAKMPKNKRIKIRDVWHFPWEKQQKMVKPFTDEQYAERLKNFEAALAKMDAL